MILSLDANTAIELLRGQRPRVRLRMTDAELRGDKLVMSAIVLYELAFGAMASPRTDHHVAELERFLNEVEVEPWLPEDAVAAAKIATDLERRGQRIGVLDTLIAGQALNRGWTVVTANTREFARVDGLAVEDWSAPQP